MNIAEKLTVVFLSTCLAIFWHGLAVAQPAQDAQIRQDLQIQQELYQARRKMTVSQAMELSAADSERFWPIYDEYQKRMIMVDEKWWELTVQFADQRDTLTNEQAKAMLDSFFGIEEERLELKRNFRKKFAKVITSRRLARFFQIENKLDAMHAAQFAAQVPLVR